MDEIKNDYIEKALNELIPILGIKEFIDHEKLYPLVIHENFKEAVKAIALYLGLPIEVIISYVPSGYRPGANDGFQSTHLVKTDFRRRGSGGITAQVSIPSNLPFYGAPNMVNFPIHVRLSKNCAENPASFIAVMAHELSHILLHSMWHKEKENEFYTDLTAIMLGFGDVMKIGRKIIKKSTSIEHGVFSSTTTTHTETTTYGYLSDGNFDFAFNKIERVLNKQKSEKNKLFKNLKRFEKQLNKSKKLLVSFERYLEYLDKNLNQGISQEDGRKISVFHQHGYTRNFQAIIKRNEVILEGLFKFVKNLLNYTGYNVEIMQKYKTQLKSDSEELSKQSSYFKKDVDILKKYVSLFYRLKLYLSSSDIIKMVSK